MPIKRSSVFIVVCSFLLGILAYADIAPVDTKSFSVPLEDQLRFIDSKKEYGKVCEEYHYITSFQRFKLLKQNLMLGDILSDSLVIEKVDPDYLAENNFTNCHIFDMQVSEYKYEEHIAYLNEDIISIDVYQYEYGAGAAHGNDNMAHFVYDREYGMRYDWNMLFGDNEAFDLYVLKRVVGEIANEDFIAYLKASEALLNFRKQGYFSITNEGLLIQYGKYEITPGASGLPSLTVPKEVLKQYMTKETYDKCFSPKMQHIAERMHNPLLPSLCSK